MELKKDIDTYQLTRPVGRFERAVLDSKSPGPILLRLVSPADMAAMHEENKKGRPEYIAMFTDRKMILYPTPDKDYELDIYFFPHMEVM